MSPTGLLLLAAGGVAVLLVLVLRFKMHPFVALVLVSIGVALIGGISPGDLVTTIEAGMGSVFGHIAVIIALGAMIGRIIELSGGAQSLATGMIKSSATGEPHWPSPPPASCSASRCSSRSASSS